MPNQQPNPNPSSHPAWMGTHHGRTPARRVGDAVAQRGRRHLKCRDPIMGLSPPQNLGAACPWVLPAYMGATCPWMLPEPRCCLSLGAACPWVLPVPGCRELLRWEPCPPPWGKASGCSPMGTAGDSAGGRGERQRAGLFSTIWLAWSEAAAQADGSSSGSSAAISGVGKKKWGEKRQKSSHAEGPVGQPPFAAPYAHSCALLRLAGSYPSASRDLQLCAMGCSGHWGLRRNGYRGEPKGWPGAPPNPGDTEKERGTHAGMCRGCGRSVLGVRPSPAFPRAGNPPGVRGWAGGCSQNPPAAPPSGVGLGSGPEAAVPVPRVPHPVALGTRSPLVTTPAPNAPRAGRGRPDPHPTRVLRSIIRYRNKSPASPGFQAMPSLAVQPRAAITRLSIPGCQLGRFCL